MEVKEAVRAAKEHATLVFEGETVRLEELWFDDIEREWCVTVGLQRLEPGGVEVMTGRAAPTRLHYKTIRIDDKSKSIKSVRNHETMPVAPR